MDTIYYEQFAKYHPGVPFPWHEDIVGEESYRILKDTLLSVDKKFDIGRPPFAHGTVHDARGVPDRHIHLWADEYGNKDLLGSVLSEFSISPTEHVYIFTDDDEGVKFRFREIEEFFDDIFFGSEDLIFFDDSRSWIALIVCLEDHFYLLKRTQDTAL